MPATYRGLVTQRALAATLAGAQASGLDTRRLNLPDAVDANTLRNVLMDASQQAGLPGDTADTVMRAAADATRRSDYGVPRGSRNPSNPQADPGLKALRSYADVEGAISRPDYDDAIDHIPNGLMPGSGGEQAFLIGFRNGRRGDKLPPELGAGSLTATAGEGFKVGRSRGEQYKTVRTKKGGEQLSFLNPTNPPSALWPAVIVGGIAVTAYAWHAKHRHYTPVGAPVQGPADAVPVDVAAIVHAYLRGHGITTDNVTILSPVGPPWHCSADYWTDQGLQTIDLIVKRGMWGWQVDLNQ